MLNGRAAAVGDEAVAIAGQRADLADLAAERHRRRHDVGRALRALHDLEQLHDVGRGEEMRAGDVLRPLRRIGHDVDVDARGVGVEQRARLHDRVELFEDLLLDRDLLEHRLDDDVAIGDVVDSSATGSISARRRSISSCGEAAALDAGLVIGADARHAAVERLWRGVEDLHVESRNRQSSSRCRRPSCRRRPPPRLSVGRSGVSRGMSGSLATSRSAKKA